MTLGGTETNAESFIKLEIDLPQEQNDLNQVLRCWSDILNISLPLTQVLLNQLTSSQTVIDEAQMRRNRARSNQLATTSASTNRPIFPVFQVIPPSPVPAQIASNVRRSTGRATRTTTINTNTALSAANTQALVIQIKPHHNGEIFLSKNAINQNPTFFGWPFTGQTIPKKSSNPSYPQRTPDPVVNIFVYDTHSVNMITTTNFNLNTVYYSKSSEIRIPVPPNGVQNTPHYSIMVMRESNIQGIDYDIYIYPPISTEFTQYITICNQSMPTGGRSTSRRFGWI